MARNFLVRLFAVQLAVSYLVMAHQQTEEHHGLLVHLLLLEPFHHEPNHSHDAARGFLQLEARHVLESRPPRQGRHPTAATDSSPASAAAAAVAGVVAAARW